MSDNLENRGNADRSRINLNEQWEVDYWTKKLGCTDQQLRNAVQRAGVMVKDVENLLATHPR